MKGYAENLHHTLSQYCLSHSTIRFLSTAYRIVPYAISGGKEGRRTGGRRGENGQGKEGRREGGRERRRERGR
eukprot:3842210-Rhodomonas_salina.2